MGIKFLAQNDLRNELFRLFLMRSSLGLKEFAQITFENEEEKVDHTLTMSGILQIKSRDHCVPRAVYHRLSAVLVHSLHTVVGLASTIGQGTLVFLAKHRGRSITS